MGGEDLRRGEHAQQVRGPSREDRQGVGVQHERLAGGEVGHEPLEPPDRHRATTNPIRSSMNSDSPVQMPASPQPNANDIQINGR